MKVEVVDRPDVFEVTVGDKVIELPNKRTVEDVRNLLVHATDTAKGYTTVVIHTQVDSNVYIAITIDLESVGMYSLFDIVCRHLEIKR